MMRQSFEFAFKGRLWRALQAKKDVHGQEGESCVFMSGGLGANQVRQGSSTSSWDVGSPPTDGGHPADMKNEQGEKKDPPRVRQDETPTPNLQKETSTRQFFHDRARETEERLSQEGKSQEAQDSKK